MGVRPPSNGGEPAVIEFGIAALDAKLSDADVSYPTDAATLVERVGSVEVPYDAAGNTITLATAIKAADESEFENKRELLNALHPIFEDKREAAATSFIAQLRSLVPF